MREIREESRIVNGFHDIYGTLYDEIGVGKVMKKCKVSALVSTQDALKLYKTMHKKRNVAPFKLNTEV